MDTASLIFYLLATLLVIASLLVVFLRNVVHCAMALVSALLLIAVLFVTLQAPMVGVLQVLVYAGAIMVLFLFVIMFLNPAALERQRGLWWGFGTVLALMLAGVLVPLVMINDLPAPPSRSTR
jgi:NADH-quinone oxidoreductase subunit J